MTWAEELKVRTKKFAISVVRFVRTLPHNSEGYVIGRQLLRSGTSVGANYRAACRGRSRAEFIAKLGIVVEEIDESVYWLELLKESETTSVSGIEELHSEANELLRILGSSHRTATATR
jgi:four helix bundle protein